MPEFATNTVAEREIVSALLYDPRFIGQLLAGTLPGASGVTLDEGQFTDSFARQVIGAMIQLSREDKSVTMGTILSVMGKGSDRPSQDALQRLDDNALSSLAEALPENVQRIANLAMARQMRRSMERDLATLVAKPEDSTTLAGIMSTTYGTLAMRRAQARDNRAAAIIERGKHKTVGIGKPMGFAWLDDPGDPAHGRPGMIAGMAKGEKMVVQGIYGGRKTAFITDVCISFMRTHKSTDAKTGAPTVLPPETICYFMMDDNQSTLANWFIAKLATGMLRKWGVPEEQWLISARGLDERLRNEAQHTAIEEAEKIFKNLPIIIPDGEDGIHDWDVAKLYMKDAILRQGATTIVLDYAQDFIMKGTPAIYEMMRIFTAEVNAMASAHGCKMIIASQRSEATNNNYGKTGEGAGTKGGGDLPAKANYIINTRPFAKNPAIIYLDVLKSRFGPKNVTRYYKINPSSGLFLDAGSMGAQGAPPEVVA